MEPFVHRQTFHLHVLQSQLASHTRQGWYARWHEPPPTVSFLSCFRLIFGRLPEPTCFSWPTASHRDDDTANYDDFALYPRNSSVEIYPRERDNEV